jgi:hypothetical protein
MIQNKKPLIIAFLFGYLPLMLMAGLSFLPLSENSALGFFTGALLLLSSLYYSPVQFLFDLPRQEIGDFLFAATIYFVITLAITLVVRRAIDRRSRNSKK